MKANKLPKSDACDSSYHSPSAGSKADQINISANDEYPFNSQQSYNDNLNGSVNNDLIDNTSSYSINAASNDADYVSANLAYADSTYANSTYNNTINTSSDISCGYKKASDNYTSSCLSLAKELTLSDKSSSILDSTLCALEITDMHSNKLSPVTDQNSKVNKSNTVEISQKNSLESANQNTNNTKPTVSERIFMTSLIKHTGIALAIIIPLAAFSAYAATPNQPLNSTPTAAAQMTDIDIAPNAIIHKSASVPTTVDNVNLNKYAGTWYEIGRLPMYFQRNCASDVTANYTEKTDGSGIIVTNKCLDEKGSQIVAEGLAKPADATGSKLKVTFLPSWIRWLPVGKADYWVLARDADYKTALVGTPDKKYLWLLARSPNVSQQTYAKYRQIAQAQGYDLKEFTLTPHNNQMVKLVP